MYIYIIRKNKKFSYFLIFIKVKKKSFTKKINEIYSSEAFTIMFRKVVIVEYRNVCENYQLWVMPWKFKMCRYNELNNSVISILLKCKMMIKISIDFGLLSCWCWQNWVNGCSQTAMPIFWVFYFNRKYKKKTVPFRSDN